MSYRISNPRDTDHIRIDHIGGLIRETVSIAHDEAMTLLEQSGRHRLLVVIHDGCVMPNERLMVRFVSSVADRMCGRISIAVAVLGEQTSSIALLEVIARAHGLNHRVFCEEGTAAEWLSMQPESYDISLAIDPGRNKIEMDGSMAQPSRRRSDLGVQ